MLGMARLVGRRASVIENPPPPPPIVYPTTLTLAVSYFSSTSVSFLSTYDKGTNGPASRTYTLEQSTDNVNWFPAPGIEPFTTDRDTNSYNIYNLLAGRTYYYRLRTDDPGLTAYTNVTLSGQVPGVVQNFLASSSRDYLQTISLSWSEPSNGGVPITNYKLVYLNIHDGSARVILDLGNVTSWSYNGFLSGVDYAFQIYAENAVGFSPTFAFATAHAYGFSYQVFEYSTTWTRPVGVDHLEMLIVGGGGGGGVGGVACGGGGGGEVYYYNDFYLGSSPVATYSVVVGSGGESGQNGGNSSFGGEIAHGGGAGGLCVGANAAGATGGCGGGGSKYNWDSVTIVGGGSSNKGANGFGQVGGNAWEGAGSSIVIGGGGGGVDRPGGTDSVTIGSFSNYIPGSGGTQSPKFISPVLGTVGLSAGGGGATFMRGSQTNPAQYTGEGGYGGGLGALLNENQILVRAASDAAQFGAGGGGGGTYGSAHSPGGRGFKGIVKIGWFY